MFKTLIYCNLDKVIQYGELINNKRHIQIDSVEVTKGGGAELLFPAIKGKIDGSTKMIGYVNNNNILFEYNQFEDSLKSIDDVYFDFVDCDDYDIKTIPVNSIIRFRSRLVIPEEFDMIQLIEEYKPILLQYNCDDMEEDARAFLKTALDKETINIPTIYEMDDTLLYSKLKGNFLIEEYSGFEDLDGEELTILARVITHKTGKTIIYDPLKDFIKINRAMRRQGNFSSLPKELDGIFIESDNIIALEIIALYQ